MGVPLSQMWTVATYVLGQRLRGRRRYPLVLMLEPLFRCNLACAGCGKIQYPAHILKQHLSVEDCLKAVEECGAPMVSIPGGEPLMHPEIDVLVRELVRRRKYIYLCTNAILLREKIDLFTPSKYLTFSIHMDGQEEHHDFAVCREGVYQEAAEAIRLAVQRGFRVTTNTTLFEGADPNSVRLFFDEMMALGVEGMMVSPGYAYEKAPDQKNFLKRQRTHHLFNMILSNRPGLRSMGFQPVRKDAAGSMRESNNGRSSSRPGLLRRIRSAASRTGWKPMLRRRWRFNQSPLFLEFLMGRRDYECTPWGNPTYNLFGWQRPCYLLQDGYVDTFAELMQETQWENYGRASGNDKCQNCMVHCGYEPSAVNHTFSSLGGMLAMIRGMLFTTYRDDAALKALEEERARPHGPLVQLGLAEVKPGDGGSDLIGDTRVRIARKGTERVVA